MTIQSVKAVALLLLCLSAVVGLAVTYESVDAAGGFATDEGPTGPINTIEGSEESSSISDPDDDSNPQLPLFFPTVDWMENTEDRSQITADGVFGGIAAVLIIGSLGLGVVTVYLTSGDGDQHEDTPDEPAAEIPIGEGVNSRSISPSNEIYGIWWDLARRINRPQYRTPWEVAERSVDRGYPQDPVSELTELFCTVRYGSAQPSSETISRAQELADQLGIRDEDETPE